MVTVPPETPLTVPFAETMAIKGLLDLQITFLFVASAGRTVAVSCLLSPVARASVVGETLTDVTGMVPPGPTVKRQLAVFLTILSGDGDRD